MREFRVAFEKDVGDRVLEIVGVSKARKGSDLLAVVDELAAAFSALGLVALVKRNGEMDEDLMDDWKDGLRDLTFSVAVYGDVTQSTQILLQEQDMKLLVPDFFKYALKAQLQAATGKERLEVDEYYLDDNYSSDPKKFKVKEVLLAVTVPA